MSATNISLYVDYFRQLAISHNLLRHNPAAENGDAPASEMHFAKWNLNELAGSLRTKCSFPVLLLELYEISTDGSSAYDVKEDATGAITILEHVKQGDIFGEEAAYANTETILRDIIKKMWQDLHAPTQDACVRPFASIEFNKLAISTTGTILKNEMGWRMEFSFKFQNSDPLTTAPAPGTFL